MFTDSTKIMVFVKPTNRKINLSPIAQTLFSLSLLSQLKTICGGDFILYFLSWKCMTH